MELIKLPLPSSLSSPFPVGTYLYRFPISLRHFAPKSNKRKTKISTRASTVATPVEVERKKHDLLRAVQDTQRGIGTTSEQRSFIEEALVCCN